MTSHYDPHTDPLRSPSGAGDHPHLVPEGPSRRNPQHMYEQRQQVAQQVQYRRMMQRPMGQVPGPPPQPQKGLLDSPVVVFGLGVLALWAGYKLAQSAQEPRSNPAPPAPPLPQPAPAQLVVMPGPVPALPVPGQPALPPVVISSGNDKGVEASCGSKDSLKTAQVALKTAEKAVTAHQDEMKAAAPAPDKPKRKRTTTQARRKRVGPNKEPVGSYLKRGSGKKTKEGES